MKAKEHEIVQLAERMKQELEHDSKEIAQKLFLEGLPDSKRMTEAKYLEYFRRNWVDPQFRQARLQAIGPENFVKTYKAAFGR